MGEVVWFKHTRVRNYNLYKSFIYSENIVFKGRKVNMLHFINFYHYILSIVWSTQIHQPHLCVPPKFICACIFVLFLSRDTRYKIIPKLAPATSHALHTQYITYIANVLHYTNIQVYYFTVRIIRCVRPYTVTT